MIQCTPSKIQGQRARPSYLVYIQGPGCQQDQVNSSLDVSNIKAAAYEGLRFRCTDPACKYRPGSADATEKEVPEEDAEEPDVSSYLTVEEDEEAGEQDMEVEAALAGDEDDGLCETLPDSQETGPSSQGTGKKNVDVFTFALPMEFYRRILEQIRFTSHHLIIMTRTSHPNLAIAARNMKFEVTCLVQGPKVHSSGHGGRILGVHLFKNEVGRG